MIDKKYICKHCKGDIRIRNPTGKCDHLHYPEYCPVCNKSKKPFRIRCFKCQKVINSYPFMIMDNKLYCFSCGDKETVKKLEKSGKMNERNY